MQKGRQDAIFRALLRNSNPHATFARDLGCVGQMISRNVLCVGLLVLMADSERYSLGSFLQVLVVRNHPNPTIQAEDEKAVTPLYQRPICSCAGDAGKVDARRRPRLILHTNTGESLPSYKPKDNDDQLGFQNLFAVGFVDASLT